MKLEGVNPCGGESESLPREELRQRLFLRGCGAGLAVPPFGQPGVVVAITAVTLVPEDK
jgi:hypothetical protein